MDKAKSKIKEIDRKFAERAKTLNDKKRDLFLNYRKKLEGIKLEEIRRQINNSK